MILHLNKLLGSTSAVGFIDNTDHTSSAKNVYPFHTGHKMSYADFHNLSTTSAQPEAKHWGFRVP